MIFPDSLFNHLSVFNIHYDEIGSDHRPLGFKLDILTFYSESLVEYTDQGVRYEVGNRKRYKDNTERELKQIQIPIDALLCKDRYCTNISHSQDIISFAEGIIFALLKSGDKKVPKSSHKSHNIPGWNDFVKEYYKISREKYVLWRNLGCPRSGLAYQQMILSKRDFKRALKIVKGTKDIILKNKVARDMKAKKPWSTINKVRERKSKLPVKMNGISGEKEIAECWKDHYSRIMSGEGHPPVERHRVPNHFQIPRVNVKEVKDAFKKLSLTSAPGLDHITGEHLKYAHPTLQIHFSFLFTLLFSHSNMPNILTNIKICNLVKDQQKSLSDMSNYRPIALASLVSKLFECIILQRCEKQLGTTDNQFAYKSQHSTDMALFLLKQTVEFYRSKRTPIFICSMDLSKAFDRVCHNTLFKILIKRKIPPYIINVLENWYATQRFIVKWGNEFSSPFQTKCGIRQGSVLSALLFAVYVDDLSDKHLNNELGCSMGDNKINHILYADDLILISPSVKSLQNQIDTCKEYFVKHHLTVNAEKTKVMVIKPKGYMDFGIPELCIDGERLEVVQNIKYLGMHINSELKDDEHITSLYRGQCMRGNLLLRNFYMCDVDAKVHLFKSFCTSLYSIPLSLACKKESFNKLRVCYNNSLRFFMNIDRFSSITEQFVILGVPSFNELLRKTIASLYLRLKRTRNKLLVAVFSSTYFRNSPMFLKWSSHIFTET